jgi:hypothetical protein
MHRFVQHELANSKNSHILFRNISLFYFFNSGI